MSKRVVVTGIGLVTPVGHDMAATWEALCAGRSGVAPITSFDTHDHAVTFGAEVKDFDPTPYYENKKEIRRNDPFVHLALAASKQAIADADFVVTEENADDVGVLIGSGVGGIKTLHEQFRVLFEKGPDRISPFFVTMYVADMAAGYVSMAVGARGPNFAPVSACATGANAIGEAAEIIRRGAAVAMLAGGTECGISPIAVAAFASMHALSRRNDEPARASRPFDAERDGFVMGEGAGILLLEEADHARARGARIYAELVGYGTSSDGYHIVEPAPGGEGLVRAMRRALEQAEAPADTVGYINAHGTSTAYNDERETAAIKTVFGEHAYTLAVSSTKSMIGHTFGAAGAIEAAVTVLTIANSLMTPTINYEHPDPACDLDYVPNVAREARVEVALSNSMGFGGHNAVLVFRRYV
ncbi:MAG TPA: beta-ketoacyl-ACP synthase II [Ktedonobacterales bacterium]|nr:beta-ketoacyl-ACP synthase II [Ktedonobacterales bacterium]